MRMKINGNQQITAGQSQVKKKEIKEDNQKTGDQVELGSSIGRKYKRET